MNRLKTAMQFAMNHPVLTGTSASAALAAMAAAISMGGDGAAGSAHNKAPGLKPGQVFAEEPVRVAVNPAPSASFDRFGAFVDQGYVSPASDAPDGDDWSKVTFTGKDGILSADDITPDMMRRADLAAVQAQADTIYLDYIAHMEILFNNSVGMDDFVRSTLNNGREETLMMTAQMAAGVMKGPEFLNRAGPETERIADLSANQPHGGFYSDDPERDKINTSDNFHEMSDDLYVALAAAGRDTDKIRDVVTETAIYADVSPERSIGMAGAMRRKEDVLRSRIVQDADFKDPIVARAEERSVRLLEDAQRRHDAYVSDITEKENDIMGAISRDFGAIVSDVRADSARKISEGAPADAVRADTDAILRALNEDARHDYAAVRAEAAENLLMAQEERLQDVRLIHREHEMEISGAAAEHPSGLGIGTQANPAREALETATIETAQAKTSLGLIAGAMRRSGVEVSADEENALIAATAARNVTAPDCGPEVCAMEIEDDPPSPGRP